MKRVDINACFGHWQYWDVHHKTPDELVALMDRNGIDQAACLSLRGILVDWRLGNEETLAAAKQFADRLVPMATISPFLRGDADELNRLIDAGFKGVRLFPTFHSYRLDSDFIDAICNAAGERGVPVMLQTRLMMNWRFKPIAIENIGELTQRHPDTNFVLSGPNYLVEFQAAVHVMKRCPNVWFEISCLQGFGAIRRLVAEVGAERVLFGTGALLNYPACNVKKLDHAEITATEREMIAGANALKLLRLT